MINHMIRETDYPTPKHLGSRNNRAKGKTLGFNRKINYHCRRKPIDIWNKRKNNFSCLEQLTVKFQMCPVLGITGTGEQEKAL